MTKTECLEMIEHIEKLDDNWNGYGASKFTDIVIKNARDCLSRFDTLPDRIFPTGCNSVQFEWKKDAILEAEIFEDRMEMFVEGWEKTHVCKL